MISFCSGFRHGEKKRKDPASQSVFQTQRVHLFPFRTQKLSFAVLTILAWRRAGKISHSRQRRIKYSGISKRDSRRTEKSGKPISPEMRRRRHSLKTVRRATLAFLIALYPTFLLSSCRSIPTEHGVIFIPPQLSRYEHLTVNQVVAGSSPAGGAILIGQKCNLCQKALFYKAFSVFQGKFFDLLFFATFSEPSGLEPTTFSHI